MKLRANEYCACIGFSDNKAIVGKREARRYRGYNVAQFLREGLFRQAFSLAYYLQDEAQMQTVLQELQAKMRGAELPGRSIPQTVADLVKLFGCIPAPRRLGGILFV